MTHDSPGAWWPELDHAIGGVASSIDTTVEKTGETLGGFIGGAAGGALQPLANFMLQLAAIGAVAWLVGRAL